VRQGQGEAAHVVGVSHRGPSRIAAPACAQARPRRRQPAQAPDSLPAVLPLAGDFVHCFCTILAIFVPEWAVEQHTRQAAVRRALLASPLLTSAELSHGSGVILGARRA
jgi:hypothetical protein